MTLQAYLLGFDPPAPIAPTRACIIHDRTGIRIEHEAYPTFIENLKLCFQTARQQQFPNFRLLDWSIYIGER